MKPKIHLISFGAMAVIAVLLIKYDNDGLPGNPKEASFLMPFSYSEKVEDISTTNNLYSIQKINPVKVPENIAFAGEVVPLNAQDVRERMDRELLVNTYWHSNSIQLFKLASRYFPTIEKILAEHGVPDDFKYLALIESGLRNVVSPRGAVGFWQILEGTAKDYGLEVSEEVDERYHLEKSTQAACRYLLASKEKFGSWALAGASYNIGSARLGRLLEEQKVDNYYDLYLNTETDRYIFRILAIKEVFNSPEKYGFYLDDEDLYKPVDYTEVVVNKAITDLPAFAIENNTTYRQLKLLNPWLREPRLLNAAKKPYTIKIPG